jgi:hypothetical protein
MMIMMKSKWRRVRRRVHLSCYFTSNLFLNMTGVLNVELLVLLL